jgi:hypothetical protein
VSGVSVAADDVHQRRLAATRAADEREVVATLDCEVDVSQGVHRDLAGAVDLGDVLERHQRPSDPG